MPEMQFVVQWPDETISSCYSPSLVVMDYLIVGESYPVEDFIQRCRTALNIASERVKQKYGFYCTSAASQLDELERLASAFEASAKGRVKVLRFE